MTRATLAAGASRSIFAHLMGVAAPAPRAEDPKPEDDKPVEGAAGDVEDGDCEECGGTGMDDNEDPCDACDGTGGKEGKRSKKVKAEEDEESDEEKSDDEKVSKAAKAGRAFERARCRAIFAAPSAGVRPDMAAELAFGGKLSAKAAIRILDTAASGHSPAPARALRPRVALGAGSPAAPAAGTAETQAARILAAGKKARGEA